jgi:hypothetical protein
MCWNAYGTSTFFSFIVMLSGIHVSTSTKLCVRDLESGIHAGHLDIIMGSEFYVEHEHLNMCFGINAEYKHNSVFRRHVEFEHIIMCSRIHAEHQDVIMGSGFFVEHEHLNMCSRIHVEYEHTTTCSGT